MTMKNDVCINSVIPDSVLSICRKLKDHGHDVYIVGGAIRDVLLGRDIPDWDLTSSATPQEVMDLFKHTIPTGIQHGTVTILSQGVSKNESFEITTFRGDGCYKDGRHPDNVVFGVSLEEDLARRDFTVNAIAYDVESNQMIDPFNGIEDIQNKTLRAVGDPALRFQEDGLRIMRAVRFMSVLGFDLESTTYASLSSGFDSLALVSVERVQKEMFGLLEGEFVFQALRMAWETKIIDVILPELLNAHFEKMISILPVLPPQKEIRMAALFLGAQDVESLIKRFKLSRQQQTYIHGIQQGMKQLRTLTPSDIKQITLAIVQIGQSMIDDVLLLYELVECNQTMIDVVRARINEGLIWSISELAVSGHDLMTELPMKPGPCVGVMLNKLYVHVLDNPSSNDFKQLITLAKKINASSAFSKEVNSL